jgi:hypothetical protein
MAKISLSKIAPIKKIDPVTIKIGEEEVIVTQYLSTDDKIALIERVLNVTVDDTGFFNPMRLEVYFHLEIIRTYTNISITDNMMANPTKTYDLLIMNQILDAVLEAIPEEEYEFLFNTAEDCATHITEYNNSIMGVLHSTSQDYAKTSVDFNKLLEDLDDPAKIGFVKEVLEKLG